LCARQELWSIKKRLARRYFYRHIDLNLRLLNAHVLRCDCATCLGRLSDNYPVEMNTVYNDGDLDPHTDLEDGEVFLDSIREDHRIKSFVLCKARRTGDVGSLHIETLASMDPSFQCRQDTSCRLMDYFADECRRCGLPCPRAEEGETVEADERSNLWNSIGHDYRDVPRHGSWADKVCALSYPAQVSALYGGLLANIGRKLFDESGTYPTFCDYASFTPHVPLERWFVASDIDVCLALV